MWRWISRAVTLRAAHKNAPGSLTRTTCTAPAVERLARIAALSVKEGRMDGMNGMEGGEMRDWRNGLSRKEWNGRNMNASWSETPQPGHPANSRARVDQAAQAGRYSMTGFRCVQSLKLAGWPPQWRLRSQRLDSRGLAPRPALQRSRPPARRETGQIRQVRQGHTTDARDFVSGAWVGCFSKAGPAHPPAAWRCQPLHARLHSPGFQPADCGRRPPAQHTSRMAKAASRPGDVGAPGQKSAVLLATSERRRRRGPAPPASVAKPGAGEAAEPLRGSIKRSHAPSSSK